MDQVKSRKNNMKINFKNHQPNNEKKSMEMWESIVKSIIKYELQGDDPASKLQGLMADNDNLKCIDEAFETKPNLKKV